MRAEFPNIKQAEVKRHRFVSKSSLLWGLRFSLGGDARISWGKAQAGWLSFGLLSAFLGFADWGARICGGYDHYVKLAPSAGRLLEAPRTGGVLFEGTWTLKPNKGLHPEIVGQ